MNLEQVYHYVQFPEELTIEHAPALEELSINYPYSSIYTLLYLTALSNGKSTQLDTALQQHAYKLSDRTNLYYLMQLSGPVLSTELSFNATDIVQQMPEIEAEPVSLVEQVVEEEIIEAIEEQPLIEEHIPEIATDTTEAVLSSEANESLQSEEIEFTENESIKSIEFIAEDEAVPAHKEEEVIEMTPVTEVIQEKEIVEEVSIEETEKVEEPLSTPINEPIVEAQPKSFTSWLKGGTKASTDSIPPIIKEEKQTESQEERIINQFIRDEPSIGKPTQEFFSASAKAKESIDDASLPVSETLAKIFAAQGNYPKAIHVYHQLMLAIPEKRSLFADQIEELKKKIK